MIAGAGDLPPIDVCQVEDRYHVLDGHHRVLVVPALGRDWIEARVTEVVTRASVAVPVTEQRFGVRSDAGVAP
jgi:uncharacterized ParB-like nuclease family protein